MTPEEKARQKIDLWFSDAGWKVVDRDNYEPNCTAVAIREGLLKVTLRLIISFSLTERLLVYLKLKEKRLIHFLIKFVNKLSYMPEMFLKFIKHIRNHCLSYLLQMEKTCIFVIFANKILVSSKL